MISKHQKFSMKICCKCRSLFSHLSLLTNQKCKSSFISPNRKYSLIASNESFTLHLTSMEPVDCTSCIYEFLEQFFFYSYNQNCHEYKFFGLQPPLMLKILFSDESLINDLLVNFSVLTRFAVIPFEV